jgi:glyoxylase-like metal-dependent hydrolase (beta-lactamase superfamily II)
MTQPQIIDTQMHGEPGLTAAFLLQGEKTALVETGPRSSVDHTLAGLEAAGVERLDHIVVTHIHLDHAGAAGTLAGHYPEASVVVHPAGAPHLVDPAKLWSSAGRIYGDEMERLWGGIDPVEPERIQVIEDGAMLDLGDRSLRAIETPGHARHHHAFLDPDAGILFTGDALGVRLPDIGTFRPATPPPEFDLEQAVASIETIRQVGASELWLTHYGPQGAGGRACSVDDACSMALDALRRWAEWVTLAREQTRDLDAASEIVKAEAERDMDGGLEGRDIERMERTTSYWMNTWGYMRYMDKIEASRGPSSAE